MRASSRQPAAKGWRLRSTRAVSRRREPRRWTRCGTQGTYVEVGVGHDPTIAPSEQIIFREVTLRGSWLYKQHEWEGLLDFVRRREVPIKSLITHRFRPEGAVEAFELANRATAGKILFDWS